MTTWSFLNFTSFFPQILRNGEPVGNISIKSFIVLKTFINMPILSLVLQNPQGHRWGNEILTTQWELTFPWLPCGTARWGRPSWAGLAGRFALLECPPNSYSCWSVPGIPTLGVGEGADRWENDPQVSGQGIELPFNCPWVIGCSLIQRLLSTCYVPGTWDATEI